jgi:hypothetical protein
MEELVKISMNTGRKLSGGDKKLTEEDLVKKYEMLHAE